MAFLQQKAKPETKVRSALGGKGEKGSPESDELIHMHELLKLVCTKPKSADDPRLHNIHVYKYTAAPQKLWACHTLEEIFRMLNG